jgi:hypothetical protein
MSYKGVKVEINDSITQRGEVPSSKAQIVQIGEYVSIQIPNDPVPSVGEVVEVISSEDPLLYQYKVLVNPGTNYLPCWMYVDNQSRVERLLVGEEYTLTHGRYKGRHVRLLELMEKDPIAWVFFSDDGSDYYCPATILTTRDKADKVKR